jgi:hypothetical protein
MLISGERGYGNDLILVHGLPLGTGGLAAGRRYPHGWLEWTDEEDKEWVWDPCADRVLDRSYYYAAGNIEETVRYTRKEALRMMHRTKTYGWWDEMFEGAERALIEAGL